MILNSGDAATIHLQILEAPLTFQEIKAQRDRQTDGWMDGWVDR
jgi:hypothetical protein